MYGSDLILTKFDENQQSESEDKPPPDVNSNVLFSVFFGILFIAAIIATVVVFTYKNSIWLEEFYGPDWQKEIIYQVYPRSFLDAEYDVNGTGDLKGITSKADYFRELGVGIIWINAIYSSPMADFGYDVSDFTSVDPLFGTSQDFNLLIYTMHDKGIKVMMDFVPNHSSDEHEWFIKSKAKDTKYDGYYVWKDPAGVDEENNPILPNNWLSVFGGSAWEYCEERGQFYLHQFLKQQPDLNYRNPDVVEEMENVLIFWLQRGVDGFRISSMKHIFEIEDVYNSDESVAEASGIDDPTSYGFLHHNYTTNQPETYYILSDWRALVDRYYKDVILTADVYDTDVTNVEKYYGSSNVPLADFPFNSFLIDVLRNRSDVTGHSIKASIDLWLDNMPDDVLPNWSLGNHDIGRVASRVGEDLVDSLNMLNLLLPGMAVTYYGEEIGMEDTFISNEDKQDIQGHRDPERTPMQWDDSDFAGFTTGNATWLPVNENYKDLNSKAQRASEQSHYRLYTKLAQLRRENTFLLGHVDFPAIGDKIFSFKRFLENEKSYLVVINLSEVEEKVDLHENANYEVPQTAVVVLRSSHDHREDTEEEEEVDLTDLLFLAGEGFVFELPEEDTE